MSLLNRDALLQALKGYAIANDFIAAERKAQLKTMTDAEARAIFNDLCAIWEKDIKHDGNWVKINQRRLDRKISTRKAFERLAKKQDLI